MRRLNEKRILTTFILLLFILMPGYSQVGQYTVKAVFLEKFTRFIDWPDETGISDITKPFILGVIGENPFGDTLSTLYADQNIKSKRVEIRMVKNVGEICGCHLLFISGSEKKNLSKILDYTRGKPILTIGDTDKFADMGVLINFYLSSGKVRFEVNESAVRESGLHFSYLLLNFAKIVKPARSER